MTLMLRACRLGLVTLLVPLALAAQAAAAPACDRACLQGYMDRYLDALVKHDVAAVPLAADAQIIHNGLPSAIDDEDWKHIDGIAFRQYVIDPQAGQIALFGVANEDFRRGTLFVRLAVKDQKLTLVETIAGVRTLERHRLRFALIDAIEEATRRAGELSREDGR